LLVESVVGNAVDAPVIAIVAGVMFMLVLLRLAGLVSTNERSVDREQVLRQSAAELVAASSRDAIYAATIAGVNALVSGHSDIVGASFSVAGLAGESAVVGRSGQTPSEEDPHLQDLWNEMREGVADGRIISCVADTSFIRSPVKTGDLFIQQLTCALVTQGQMQGLITITSATEVPAEFKSSVEILAAQVELALDREAMTDVIHTRRSEARFQTLVQNASDVILIARPDTTITYQTPSSLKILGYAAGTLEGTRFTSLLHPDDVEQALAGYTAVAFRAGTSAPARWRVKHADGSWRHVEVVTTNLLDDPTVEGMVLTMRDVSERKSLEDELKHQAFHDALSGLANRALFRDRLEHALLRAARSQSSLAVLFVDLDDFKLVNDSLGHAAGDELLVTVAGRINALLRSGDTAARFGGDEFAVLLEETAGPEEAEEVAARLIAELRLPLFIEDHEISVRASIGIALSQGGGEDPGDLMQAADVAMYAAKAGGKGRFEVYQPALQLAIVQRLERTADLQRAINAREFVMHYQPIINLEDGELVSLEALVRWHHPVHGLLLPNDFIPLAEETGLIVSLGRWILQEACQQARLWQLRHPAAKNMRMGVNISARQFQHDDLVNDVSFALQEAGLDAHSLVLEITESLLVQNAESIVARMRELKDLGVSFAIDDFGTGYSSLSYLRDFPIDILKLDKSFIDDVGKSTENGALAETIVKLGKNLNLETIAEGIEESCQLDALRSFGCQFGQGFFLAKPLPSKEISELLNGMSDEGMPGEEVTLEDVLREETVR